jgi:hypothetical protein
MHRRYVHDAFRAHGGAGFANAARHHGRIDQGTIGVSCRRHLIRARKVHYCGSAIKRVRDGAGFGG